MQQCTGSLFFQRGSPDMSAGSGRLGSGVICSAFRGRIG